jgi:hypothetical protein
MAPILLKRSCNTQKILCGIFQKKKSNPLTSNALQHSTSAENLGVVPWTGRKGNLRNTTHHWEKCYPLNMSNPSRLPIFHQFILLIIFYLLSPPHFGKEVSQCCLGQPWTPGLVWSSCLRYHRSWDHRSWASDHTHCSPCIQFYSYSRNTTRRRVYLRHIIFWILFDISSGLSGTAWKLTVFVFSQGPCVQGDSYISGYHLPLSTSAVLQKFFVSVFSVLVPATAIKLFGLNGYLWHATVLSTLWDLGLNCKLCHSESPKSLNRQ